MTSNDIMLAKEAAARTLKSHTDWKTTAGILRQAFSSDDKPVNLTGRARREWLECLTNKYREEDKKWLKKRASCFSRKSENVLLNAQERPHL